MNKNALRILCAVFAGIMLAAAITSCGEVEKPGDLQQSTPVQTPAAGTASDTGPESPVSEITSQPEGEQEPEESAAPAAEQGSEQSVSEPEQTESYTEPAEPEQPAEQAVSEDTASSREKIVEIATGQLGVPFCQGGQSPEEGFDSTGFAYYCVNQAGIKFPRKLSEQLESGELVSYSDMKPGDIAYFSAEEGGEASFCGVYAGGGLIIYSPVPDDFVKTANITTNYWTTHFVTGLRVNTNFGMD